MRPVKRDYLTILEVADELGVEYRQAYLIVRAEIPHYRVSRKDTRIPRTEFEAWRKKALKPIKPAKAKKKA